MKNLKLFAAQSGVSLIELMIAMVLGLLLILGALEVFLATSRTYGASAALSKVQEGGRFSLDFLGYDIRNAGYKGECVTPLSNLTRQTDARYTLELGLQGFDGDQGVPEWFHQSRKPGTDAILVKHAATSSGVQPVTSSTYNNLKTSGSGLAHGRLLVLADPLGCELFANDSATSSTSVSVGSGLKFGHLYPVTSEILKYESNFYYVKNDDQGGPALYRMRFGSGGASEEELVEGIQDLQIQYAKGDGNGAISGQYLDAQSISDWTAVVSVRISLTVASVDAGSHVARTFISTIAIRNRLP